MQCVITNTNVIPNKQIKIGQFPKIVESFNEFICSDVFLDNIFSAYLEGVSWTTTANGRTTIC